MNAFLKAQRLSSKAQLYAIQGLSAHHDLVSQISQHEQNPLRVIAHSVACPIAHTVACAKACVSCAKVGVAPAKPHFVLLCT